MAEEYYTVDAEISATQLDKICYPLTLLTLTYLSVNVYYWDTIFQHDFSQLLVIVTNGFAIFPIIVARGIFLKTMLMGAMITSFWHTCNGRISTFLGMTLVGGTTHSPPVSSQRTVPRGGQTIWIVNASANRALLRHRASFATVSALLPSIRIHASYG